MNIIGIIPARFASTRFPGKPLAEINNKPIIRLVYEQACKALDKVYIATDDQRIKDAVTAFGGKVIMTSIDHKSGTDRCAEALRELKKNGAENPDVVINIQGDEPFIQPEQIKQLVDIFKDPDVEISTLIKEIKEEKELKDTNKPKVVVSLNGDALYFSRSIIPYMRDRSNKSWIKAHRYFKHIGIYGYRADILLNICELPPSDNEIAESLEQLRWIDNGFRIRTAITSWESIGIDTPDDLESAKLMLKSD